MNKKYKQKFLINNISVIYQVNEETGNRRPVMISLIETEKPKPEKSETNSEDKDEDMKEAPAAPPTESKSQSGSGTEENAEKPKRPSLPNLKKLSDEDCSTLLHACTFKIDCPPWQTAYFRSAISDDTFRYFGHSI